MNLLKRLHKTDLEVDHIQLQMTKTKLEIQLVEHQLKVGEVSTGGFIFHKTKNNYCTAFSIAGNKEH